ncbi:hypothetical protein [Sphaerisporangium aureirubrum]|uniref:Uncharacterized protein n=1 Tax=Sphaerisporangium aureirubrum TaxID=1544736 RepID=A0ABW1NXM2_9ACTN
MRAFERFADRYPALGLIAAGLIVGALPFVLVAEELGRSEYWPRMLPGAGIGAIALIIPILLMLNRKARRAAWAVLALLVVTTVVIIGARARHDGLIPLWEPGQAEWLGALTAVLIGSSLVMLIGGISLFSRHARGRGHRGYVQESGRTGTYVAACDCGWRATPRHDSSQAFTDAGDHANRVALTIYLTDD